MYLFTKQTHSLREQTSGYHGRQVGRRDNREFETEMCTLIYSKWVADKFLWYSAENSSSILHDNLNGKII